MSREFEGIKRIFPRFRGIREAKVLIVTTNEGTGRGNSPMRAVYWYIDPEIGRLLWVDDSCGLEDPINYNLTDMGKTEAMRLITANTEEWAELQWTKTQYQEMIEQNDILWNYYLIDLGLHSAAEQYKKENPRPDWLTTALVNLRKTNVHKDDIVHMAEKKAVLDRLVESGTEPGKRIPADTNSIAIEPATDEESIEGREEFDPDWKEKPAK